MEYPNCHLRCNGLLNCRQLENLISMLEHQNGREDTISIYMAMLKRNFKRCQLLNSTENKAVASMY